MPQIQALQGNGRLVIDGALLDGAGSFQVLNPADGSVVGSAQIADDAAVDAAVEAAQRAFPAWSALPAERRARHLEAMADWLLAHEDELSRLLTLEQGKPRSESKGEVRAAAKAFRWYAAEAVRAYGEIMPTDSPNLRSFVIKQPVGVVACIVTWNYPLGLMSWKVGPALAAGCTVVVKPAGKTPLSTLAIIEGALEAGLPAGVLNGIAGRGEAVGARLAAHPLVRKISFTGGTETGRALLHLAADTVKRVTLELGGHSPMLVAADAPLDIAVADAAKRSFRNAGQLCNSVNRIYVHETIADEFAARLATAAGKMRLGFGLDEPEPDLGPLSMASGLQRVEEHVEDARAKGGQIIAGGSRPNDERLAHGWFYPPTVVDHATDDMRMVTQETFGPVVPILRVATMDEAIERANSLEFGLVAFVYTKDLKFATRSAERLEFGTVNINNVGGGDVPFPYPGWKQSGLGVELSHHGLEEYLAVKHVRLGIGY